MYQQHQMYYPNGVPQPPLTPLDMSYSQSMIPSNLLVGSPYFMNGFSPQLPAKPQFHHLAQHQAAQAVQAAQAHAQAQAHVQAHVNAQIAHTHAVQSQAQQAQIHAYAQAQAIAATTAAIAANPFRPGLQHTSSSSSLNYNLHQSHSNNSLASAAATAAANAATVASPLDMANLPRTIILKHISEDLRMEDILDHIEYGPIEYCNMVKKPSPPQFGTTKTMQTCYISFLNSKISTSMYLKYSKNKANLTRLRTQLNSEHLKLALQDPTRSKHETMKLKVLNYIVDFHATRAVMIKFIPGVEIDQIIQQCERFGDIEKLETDNQEEILETEENEQVDDEENELENELVKAEAENEIVETEVENELFEAQVENEIVETEVENEIGETEVENEGNEVEKESAYSTANASTDSKVFEVVAAEAESDSDTSPLITIYIHFTSLESSIRCYEYYIRKIQHNMQVLDGVKTSPVEFISFIPDRCNRTLVESYASSSSPPLLNTADSTTTSSPIISRRTLPSSHSQFLPNESIISIPEDDSFGSEGSEFSEFNSQMILDNNESIRKTLLKKKQSQQHEQQPRIPVAIASSEGESDVDFDDEEDYESNSSMPPMFSPMPPYMPYTPLNLNVHHHPPQHAPIQRHKSTVFNPDPRNIGNRTIYLGNLHPNTTIEDIANNVRASGIVQYINHRPEKKSCFITFVDPTVALKYFLNHQVLHQLVIHGFDITVGWAKKHSGPLPREIALAVTAGASRNVYLGIKTDEPDLKGDLPNEATLRRDFGRFGQLEQINFYHNKDCVFLNFINISDAIKLVESFASKNSKKVTKIVGDSGQFYQKYSIFKINFAKDRCGNPPKFNFRKKPRQYESRNDSYNQDFYEIDIVNELRENSRIEEERKSLEPEISEEAAMVFGITSLNVEDKSKATDENGEETQRTIESIEDIETKDGLSDVVSDAVSDASESEEEDDDDDVSIIINPNEMSSSSIVSDSKSSQSPQRATESHFYKSKARNVRKSQSETFLRRGGYDSRNSSNASLNSYNKSMYYQHQHHQQYGHQPYHHQYQYQQFSHPPSPYQQPVYYSGSQRPGSRNGGGQGGYFNYQAPTPPPSHGYMHHHSGPQSPLPFQYPPHNYHGEGKSYSTSGSQVMAQYLAQSQNDGLFYANTLIDNDIGHHNYHYHNKPIKNHRR